MGNVAAAMQAEQLKLGHDADVLTPWYRRAGEGEEDKPHVHRLRPWLQFGNAALIPSLRRVLDAYDVIHLHYPFFGGAEFIRKRPGQRFVATYHMDTVGRGLKAPVFATYRALFMPSILSCADAITVSSFDYAKHSALAPFLGRWPVHEVPFGVDEAFKPGAPSQPSDSFKLVFVGALDRAHYFKGLTELLGALRIILRQDIPAELAVVGDGDMRIFYEEEVGRLGLQEHVLFRGRVDRDKLVATYQGADALVLPSIDRSEAFGLVLIEAMACGTPVIASNLPGVRTVFEAGKTGWVCEPGSVKSLADALASAWAARFAWPAMRAASAERVNRLYRWPVINDALMRLYRP